MAGIVKADRGSGLPGSHRFMLYPRGCPCRSSESGTLLCAEGSTASAWINLCPFLYGARVLSGGVVAEVRSVKEFITWGGFDPTDGRDWEVLCLRKESAGSKAGAHLRD